MDELESPTTSNNFNKNTEETKLSIEQNPLQNGNLLTGGAEEEVIFR